MRKSDASVHAFEGRVPSVPANVDPVHEGLAQIAVGVGIALILAGAALGFSLAIVYGGGIGSALAGLTGVGFFVGGLVAGTIQAFVGARLSEGSKSAGALQGWATGLGFLLALSSTQYVVMLASKWFLLVPLTLVVSQGIVHAKVARAILS